MTDFSTYRLKIFKNILMGVFLHCLSPEKCSQKSSSLIVYPYGALTSCINLEKFRNIDKKVHAYGPRLSKSWVQ